MNVYAFSAERERFIAKSKREKVRTLIADQPDRDFLTAILGLDEQEQTPAPVVRRSWCEKHQMEKVHRGGKSGFRCRRCHSERSSAAYKRRKAARDPDHTIDT